MCYNIIQYHEFPCTHRCIAKKQLVDCNSKNCRFSRSHETQRHNCTSTCRQTMLPDQGIIMDAPSVQCPRCAGRMNGH